MSCAWGKLDSYAMSHYNARMANPDVVSGCLYQVGGLCLGISAIVVGASAAQEIAHRIRRRRALRREQRQQTQSPEIPGFRRIRAIPPGPHDNKLN